MNDAERALAALRARVASYVDVVEEIPLGTLLHTPSLPKVWDANYVVVERWDGTAVELRDELERIEGELGFTHRKAVVHDQALGELLWPGVRELDWQFRGRSVVMAHRRDPDRPADAGVVVAELDWPAWDAVHAEGAADEPWGSDPEVVGQLLEIDHRIAATTEVRRLAALVDGEPSAYAALYVDRDAGIAQVEDVLTLGDHRGRGLARAVILRAIAEARSAGCELVFIVADEDDWPKTLYERLGFDLIGFELSFGRPGA